MQSFQSEPNPPPYDPYMYPMVVRPPPEPSTSADLEKRLNHLSVRLDELLSESKTYHARRLKQERITGACSLVLIVIGFLFIAIATNSSD